MSTPSRTQKALALLLPAGTLGASFALAAVHAQAAIAPPAGNDGTTRSASPGVAERLDSIRREMTRQGTGAEIELDPNGLLLAQWVNVGGGGLGWRNGGWGNGGWHNWGNGGWHNAPWGNGWHNWGNGGWHNWGNGGWHNGPWNNYWHNW